MDSQAVIGSASGAGGESGRLGAVRAMTCGESSHFPGRTAALKVAPCMTAGEQELGPGPQRAGAKPVVTPGAGSNLAAGAP